MRVLEATKENVIKGVANEKDIEIVTHGVVVTSRGQIVPTTDGGAVNGNSMSNQGVHAHSMREHEEPITRVRDRQDIR